MFNHYPHHSKSTIMWICFTKTVHRTTISSFLAGVILRIGTATIQLNTCVPPGVHWYLIQIFSCSSIQYDSTVNYAPYKYFLNFTIAHLIAAASPTKLCLDFSSGSTVDLDMKEIGRRRIPYWSL